MNTDIRIDVTLPRHPKFLRLKRTVGPGAMESLVSVWLAVATLKPTGRLSGWNDADIDGLGACDGLCSAMLAAGFLDDEDGVFVVHDWAIHQPWAVNAPVRSESARGAGKASGEARRAKAEIARAERIANGSGTEIERIANGSGTEIERIANGSGTPSPSPSPLPSPDLNTTPPLPSGEDPQGGDAPAGKTTRKGNARFLPPTLDEVTAYAKAERLGSPRTVKAFFDAKTANGWRVGRNPMKDWKAAYRYWVSKEPQFAGPGHPDEEPPEDPEEKARAAEARRQEIIRSDPFLARAHGLR